MKKVHGLCRRNNRHPLYKTWCEMRYRCEKPSKWNYKYYGGKGVKVCERWSQFANFLADMGEKPEGTTLDRIDRNGDYEPDNCRWGTAEQQMNNHGINRIVCVNGESMTMTQAARKNGLQPGTVWRRIVVMGWSEQDAATIPTRRAEGKATL